MCNLLTQRAIQLHFTARATSTGVYVLFKLITRLTTGCGNRGYILNTGLWRPRPRAHKALKLHEGPGQIMRWLLFAGTVCLKSEWQRFQQQRAQWGARRDISRCHENFSRSAQLFKI